MNRLLLLLALLAPVGVRASCVDSTTAFKTAPFTAQSKFFTFGFSAASFGAGVNSVTGLSKGTPASDAALAAVVRFNSSGFIDARNGDAYAAATPVPYTAGQWFSFRVDVDPVAKRYSVYATPSGGTQKTVGTWLAFGSQAQVAAIDSWTSHATSGSHQVCGPTLNGVALTAAATGTVATATTTATGTTGGTTSASGVDRFGVKKLYATASGGKDWTAKWDNGVNRTFKFADDPSDNWFHGKGDATYNPDGKGSFFISGTTPRMYIYDPAQQNFWRNVEMTVYAYRVADSGTPWGGIEGVARTNHTADTTNKCDTRGNDARFRYDGHIDFEKETNHPASVAVLNKAKWSTLPYKTWIGYKLVVYDMANGDVKLESWMDLTDGAGGGTWVKVNEIEDTGKNFGVGGTPCKSGIDPALRLTNNDARQGTETGKPNLAVYWRSDNVGTNGLVYKKMSVREIAAP